MDDIESKLTTKKVMMIMAFVAIGALVLLMIKRLVSNATTASDNLMLQEEMADDSPSLADSELRAKLLTNMTLVVPKTSEQINFSGEEGKWSEGYVLIGDRVVELPLGALATTIDVNRGGNARDVYLAVFEPEENAWQMTDGELLGDYASNAQINDLYAEADAIHVTFSTYGGDMSSQADVMGSISSLMFTYENGKLQAIGVTADPNADLTELVGTSWVWNRTEMNDDTMQTPKVGDFVLTFKDDSSFQSTSDCNVINGSYGYNAATGQIIFSDLFQTQKLCVDSLEDVYVNNLQSVEMVSINDKVMNLQLKLDGGTMLFDKQ